MMPRPHHPDTIPHKWRRYRHGSATRYWSPNKLSGGKYKGRQGSVETGQRRTHGSVQPVRFMLEMYSRDRTRLCDM